LSALFGDDDGSCNLTQQQQTQPQPQPTEDVVTATPEIMTSNAITITSGTGAELAAAMKTIMITQRQERHQQRTSSLMTQGSSSFAEEREDEELEQQFDALQLQGNNNNYAEEATMNTMSEEQDAEEAQAKFFAQRFQTEWRICLKRATADFDRAMQLFWCEVSELHMLFLIEVAIIATHSSLIHIIKNQNLLCK